MLSGLEDVHDLSLTTNGYLLARQVADLVARRPAARQRLARLARARPLLRAHPPRLARRGARRARGRRGATPSCGRSRSTPSRCATSPRTRSCASPSFARRKPYEVRFIEFMPLDADRTWSADKVLPNEEIRRLIHAVYPLEPSAATRHGTSRRWRFADGQGEIGFISPVSRAVLRRLQPHPPDRRRDAAHLPVLAQRDRPARAAARRRDRRRARADHPRRRLAQGAQAPHQRAGLRPAGALDVADRRVMRPPGGRGAGRCAAARAAGDRARAAGRRGRAGRRRGRPQRGRHAAASTARRWTATRVRAADTRRRAAAAGRARSPPARTTTATLEPGTALGITTGGAIPPGADAVLQSELAEVADGDACARPSRSPPGSTSASAARTSTRAT